MVDGDRVDKRLERAGEKGHRYVKRSFERRKERIREYWLTKTGKLLKGFAEYLEQRVGCK
ncbi:MAG: hypothetical protein GXN93_04075 [Candidatus Diapherotrites archaeon]|nr:hypothetical protein [Candidatus Diapherotrites archaeon]